MLKIKSFQETLHKGYCGPASLKMIFDYYGVRVSETELARICLTDKKNGVSDKDIKRVAEEFGLKVVIKNNSSFADIKKWLAKDAPVIVNWFTKGRRDYPESAVADGHYSVVVGLDKSYIYLQDPEIGRLRKLKRLDFLRVWFDFKGKYIRRLKEMIIRQTIVIHK
jgi:predicted double-glycine peptidase